MYEKLLKKARERASESYDPTAEMMRNRAKRADRDAQDDVKLLSGSGTSEIRKGLVPQRGTKETVGVEDPIASVFNAVYASNQSIREQVKSMLQEDTTVAQPASAPKSDDSSTESFMNKILQSESSGRFGVQIVEGKKGRKQLGGFQFGEARLKDYKKATGKKFTESQFLNSPDLQRSVAEWHFADLDKLIDALDTTKFNSRDGLRAVGHLGGRTGLRKFITSGGKYNPSDSFGTSLMDYYNDFK